jgi:hypothetical protein
MSEQKASLSHGSVWRSILTDVHFWVPVVVLVAGLAVLHWIR